MALAIPAPLSEGERTEARRADEPVAFLTEAILPLGQPLERILDLDELLSPAAHQGHLDLCVQGLRGMCGNVRQTGVLGRPILLDDGPERSLQTCQLVP
jgi:hypothetical protein